MQGKPLPSRNSKLAPPPVETWLTCSARPNSSMAAAGILTADDGGRAVAGGMGHGLGDDFGAVHKGLFLKDAHGAVPHNRFRGFDFVGIKGGGFGADVKPFHIVRDIAFDNAGLGVVGHFVGDDGVDGEDDFAAGFGEQGFGEIDFVLFGEALADGFALGEEKGVGHGAADEDGVGLGQQILDPGDFVRNFGASAEDGDEGAVGVIEGFAEEFDFFFDQETDAALA